MERNKEKPEEDAPLPLEEEVDGFDTLFSEPSPVERSTMANGSRRNFTTLNQSQNGYSRPEVPERKLLAAMLARAVWDAALGYSEDQRDAIEWLFPAEENLEEPFSFVWVCWVLDVQVTAVRKRVKLRLT